MSYKIKSFYTSFIYYSGLFNLSSFARKENKIIVICYHKIRSKFFFEQMNYLIKNGDKFVSMDEVYHLIKKGKKIDQDVFAITFDDGYFHNYKECFSVIKKLKIPVMIYLSTNHISTNKFFWWDRLRILIENFDAKSIDIFGESFDLSTRHARQSSFDKLASRMKKMPFTERDNHIKSLSERIQFMHNKKNVPQMYNRKQANK